MAFWLILISLLGNILAPPFSAPFQTTVEVSDVNIQYLFGETATFTAKITTSLSLNASYLMISQSGSPTRTEPVTPTENGEISLTLNLSDNFFRPFSRIEYWYHFTLSTGEDVDSEKYSFDYEDNHFIWQEIKNDNITVKWAAGDFDFGRQAMDVATSGLSQVQEILPLPMPQQLKIYIYPSSQDLQMALQPYIENWVAGQANPELGVILVAIPSGPEQLLEMQRLIPHEEMHILLYAAIGDRITLLPAWLTEGLASTAETYPNPDYQREITKAAASNSLLSFSDLCRGMPREASRAMLAYAQSSSLVHFLYSSYGSSGLQALIQAYQDGMSCVDGAQKALNASLNELEYRWQQSALGLGAGTLIWQNLLPYIVILLLVLLIPLFASLRLFNKKNIPGKPHSYPKEDR
jgi:hypothetical protein